MDGASATGISETVGCTPPPRNHVAPISAEGQGQAHGEGGMDETESVALAQHAKDNQGELRRQQAHVKFTASQKARHAARQQSSGGRASEGNEDEDRPKEENAALFNESFAADTQDINDSLARLVAESKQKSAQTAAGTGLSGARHAHGEAETISAGGGEDVREQLDALVDRVKELRKRTADATLFLTVYDLRRAQEEVGRLWASVESTRAELAPRKKFAFRSKTKPKTATAVSKTAIETERGGQERASASASASTAHEGQCSTSRRADGAEQGERQGADGPGLKGLREQEVEVSAEDADKDKDFNVTDLHKCKVTILHVLGALRLRGLKACRVVCGPVRGPIYVEGCKDCVIVAAGRQLRIHDCQDVDFYVLVASGPIIEDCGGLRFAPTGPGLRYPDYHQQLQAAGLSEVANAWGDVKDFKWHRAQKSPNWDVIPEGERESDSLSLAMKLPK